jgi:hypothetical protein
MKKLLALILCVMMFVSVMSTSAFAAYDHEDQRVWRGEGQIKDIIETLKSNVYVMQGSLAADNAVYQTVKSIDKMLNDVVDEMIKGYEPTGAGTSQPGNVISDAIIAGLRATIGGEISDYLTKHTFQYYTTDARTGLPVFDPARYIGVFAQAASNALSSKKAVAGIQAYMYYILQRSTYEKAAQDLSLLRTDMAGWGNWGKYGFDDLTRAPGAMHMPGTDIDTLGLPSNIDGTMHGVNAIFQEYLTAQGMLGVDLDGDGIWDTGIDGQALDILQGLVNTTGTDPVTGLPTAGAENAETPIWHDYNADGLPDDFQDILGNVILPGWNND